MDIRHMMRYFATIASERSLHRASETLHIAQPALSRRIRDLEEELGVALFIRNSRGVTLTLAGEVFLAEVERLLPQVEMAKDKTKRTANGQFGTLRVAFTTAVTELRPALAAFAYAKRTMPDIEFRMDLVMSDDQQDALMREEIDLGILYRRPPHPTELKYRDLRVDSYKLLVPEGHHLTNQEKVKLVDLRDEEMISGPVSNRPVTYHEMRKGFLRGGFVPRVALVADSEAALPLMVSEGLGIAFCNSSLAERRPHRGYGI